METINLSGFIDPDLQKGGLPVGSKRKWKGGEFEKQQDGSWKLISKKIKGFNEPLRNKEENELKIKLFYLKWEDLHLKPAEKIEGHTDFEEYASNASDLLEKINKLDKNPICFGTSGRGGGQPIGTAEFQDYIERKRNDEGLPPRGEEQFKEIEKRYGDILDPLIEGEKNKSKKIESKKSITKDNMDELVDSIIPSLDDNTEAEIYIERYGLTMEDGPEGVTLITDNKGIQGMGDGPKEALEAYGEQYKYQSEDDDFPWNK